MGTGYSPRHPRGLFRGLFWCVVNGGLAGLLLLAALWRETPTFWRNAGGYPLWLRDIVYILYYPALTVYFVGLASLSWMSIRLLASGYKSGVILFAVSLVQWVLLTVIVTITVWNNVDNLLNGRPLHWHPD